MAIKESSAQLVGQLQQYQRQIGLIESKLISLIQGLGEEQLGFRTLLQEANRLDLAGVSRPAPPKNLRLSLGQWNPLGLAHERRHIWQAKQVRLHPGIPA